MQLSIPTLSALIVSALIAPWLTAHGFHLDTAQTATVGEWVSAGLVALAGVSAHVWHANRQAKASAGSATDAAPLAAAPPAPAPDRLEAPARPLRDPDEEAARDDAMRAAGLLRTPATPREPAPPPRVPPRPRTPPR